MHKKATTDLQQLSAKSFSLMMTSEQALPALPQTMALWRLEKLPQAELKARLRAAGLSEVGTKRLLAQRLQSYLQTQPPPSSKSSGEESGERPSSSSEEQKSEETDSGKKRPRRKRTHARGRSPAPVRLSRSDLRSVKTLLRRHASKRTVPVHTLRYRVLLLLRLLPRQLELGS